MSKPLRRGVLAGLAALPLASTWTRSRAQSPDFPDRPLRFIVGFPPGGPNDLLTRLIAPGIGERLGRTVVVENKAGGGGFLMFYAEDRKQLRAAMANAHLEEVRFRFDFEGTKVLLA